MEENTTNLVATNEEEEHSSISEIDMSDDDSIGSGKSLKVLGCAALVGLIGFGAYKLTKKIKNRKKTDDKSSDVIVEEETVANDSVEVVADAEVESKSENKN